MAGAIMLLEQLDKVRNAVRAGTSWGLAWEAAKLDGGVDIANPPAWLVEQCREELLAQGAELLAEEDE
jgi:hypothetical protein